MEFTKYFKNEAERMVSNLSWAGWILNWVQSNIERSSSSLGPLKALFYTTSHWPIHTLVCWGYQWVASCRPLLSLNIHTHSEWEPHSEGVQYLAQGYFNMLTGGAGDQTGDLPISGQPALWPPHEPQPPCEWGVEIRTTPLRSHALCANNHTGQNLLYKKRRSLFLHCQLL